MSGKQNQGGRKTAAQRQEEERQQASTESEQPAAEAEQASTESEQPAAEAGPKPDYQVAPGRSVCAGAKGTFDEGDAIRPDHLGGGEQALKALIEKGVVVDNR